MLGHDAEVIELRRAPTSTFAPAVSPSWVPFPPEILTCLEKPSPPPVRSLKPEAGILCHSSLPPPQSLRTLDVWPTSPSDPQM